MVEFQIVSDLHLENPCAYDVFDIPAQAPHLALLGDIGVVTDAGFFSFVEAQLRRFQVVFLLLGNHEPYHSSWDQTREKICQFSESVYQRRSSQEGQPAAERLGTFVFLDQTRYDVSPDVTVLGCTLYSQVTTAHQERVSFGLNDFYYIDSWTVEDHNAAHAADLRWLNDQVSHVATTEPQRKIMILTHHSPITRDTRAVDPRHINSPLLSGFATDLSEQECWRNPRVRLWGFGHTHFNTRFTEEGTGKQIVSNQRGYYFSQSIGFDPGMVVSI
ncbi:hypothetical protein NUU61_006204 [Penicillium alfredii]|uniref:Calcineurin-like phosphoesterase domain-containing protein n=1 Tax=Penicillium alfredii TaxID=1506179 RepID=A0A9W9K334_9EURO|nr:uncharacterized protein NUU61_006204 [Penicillium alfredii]KAJ5091334.1 hypothetical protein NUU61_006204 [Penicillium alfredii]